MPLIGPPANLTTAQRDALPQVQRRPGTIIFNTTTNQLETNTGTAAAPSWLTLSGTTPSGVVQGYAGTAAPSGWLMCDGTPVSRTTFSALFAAIGTAYGAGDGSTTFNLPDMRGRVPVGRSPGGKAEVDSLGDNEGLAQTLRNVKHSHSLPEPVPSAIVNPGAPQTNLGPAPGVGLVSGTSGDTHNVNGPAHLVINYIIKS